MIIIKKKNEAKLFVTSDDSGVLMEISEFFTFYADGYKWMPAFKNKLWDGKVRMFNSRDKTLPYGLLDDVLQFAKERGYQVQIDPEVSNQFEYKEDFMCS